MFTIFALLSCATITTQAPQVVDTISRAERLEVFHEYLDFASWIQGGDIEPHWMSDGDRFWYAREENGATVYRLVDPRTATVSELSDMPRSAPQPHAAPAAGFIKQYAGVPGFWLLREKPSPDGNWIATLIDENLALRNVATDSIVMLTTDGTIDQPWGAAMWEFGVWWSPDSRFLLAGHRANRITERWPLVRYPSWEDVPARGFAPTVEMWPVWWWTKTREAFDLHLFDLRSGTDALVPIEPVAGQWLEPVEWIPDGSGALLVRRGPQAREMDLLVVNAEDASVRVLESESVERGTLYSPNEPPYWHFLEDGRRFIFRSERDGYQNLVLFDVDRGRLRTLTSGPHPVRWFREHEESGWVYLEAQLDDERPYDRHLARVPLKGGSVERLSTEPGQHSMTLSPSGRYFLDRHVSNDRPTRTDLKTADGRFIMTVESASTDRVRRELQWSPPEEFSVLAPDGTHRLYGTLFKPWDFDPQAHYPVIDYFNAVHGTGGIVLRSDVYGASLQDVQALAQLGFIVLTFDARGTHWRGREFRLSTWGTGDTQLIPEHVHVLRTLAADRPWMDLIRVGALGHSHFGYEAARAMVMAPDFYDAGVSSAGPDGQGFAGEESVASVAGGPGVPFRSNSSMAANLKGRLLLMVGTEDFQGPLYSMMPLLDALVEAGKQYDFRLIPGAGHEIVSVRSRFGLYYWDAVAEHFLRYLKD